MTREEAIEWLKHMKVFIGYDAESPMVKEMQSALDMAIKALEQQPCEDAISRKRLIILIDEGAELHPYKVVGDSETYSNYNQGWTDAFDWLYANIDCDNLPSVNPQPCEDAISREAVIRLVEQYPNIIGNRCSGLIADIKHLPPVTPSYNSVKSELKQQTRWIPVTEDTPPKGTICLWCNKQGSVFTSAITYRSECSSYVGKHGYFSNGLENYGDIVAWMPLPKPYKGGNAVNETIS